MHNYFNFIFLIYSFHFPFFLSLSAHLPPCPIRIPPYRPQRKIRTVLIKHFRFVLIFSELFWFLRAFRAVLLDAEKSSQIKSVRDENLQACFKRFNNTVYEFLSWTLLIWLLFTASKKTALNAHKNQNNSEKIRTFLILFFSEFSEQRFFFKSFFL